MLWVDLGLAAEWGSIPNPKDYAARPVSVKYRNMAPARDVFIERRVAGVPCDARHVR